MATKKKATRKKKPAIDAALEELVDGQVNGRTKWEEDHPKEAAVLVEQIKALQDAGRPCSYNTWSKWISQKWPHAALRPSGAKGVVQRLRRAAGVE